MVDGPQPGPAIGLPVRRGLEVGLEEPFLAPPDEIDQATVHGPDGRDAELVRPDAPLDLGRQQRILGGVGRVPGVEADTDCRRPGLLDQGAQLAGQQVNPAVVLA